MNNKKSVYAHLNIDSPNLAKDSILNKIVKQRLIRLEEESCLGTKNETNHDSNIKLSPSTRSLYTALQSSAGFIFECKKSSPSRGLLTDNYQPGNIAKQYEPFASAISVLTEPDYFSGSLNDLKAVRATVEQPILCKDFIVQTSQIYQARAAGADIILLMLSVVTDEFYLECHEIALTLGLDIITEVNSQQEVERAVALPAKIIGINNRNLHTLKTDVSVTERLVKGIPSDRLIVTESGISTHQQLMRLAPLVDGFLIGSSMMQSASTDLALRKLIFGEVKVCGLTRRQDADLAWHQGASFGGMIFTQKSSRFINLEQAIAICENQPMPMVGVFMDQANSVIVEHAVRLKLTAVQLHGDESIEQIKALKEELTTKTNSGCAIWKAISCSESDDQYPTLAEAVILKNSLLQNGVDRVLIDLPKDNIEESSQAKLNYQQFLTDDRVFIAGKLSIEQPAKIKNESDENVQVGFDLCSGLEKSAGVKDHQKIKDLFDALKPRTRNIMKTNDLKESVSEDTVTSAQHYFSGFGGMFAAEILVPALQQLEQEYVTALKDPEFNETLEQLLADYAGRPTPVYLCKNIAKGFNADIYLKREDLLHGGAHKTNQVLAQALLAKRMGKTRIIAETGAGQHGVATAMVCALLDLDVVIYMGEKDVIRQQPNVQRMELLGAKVITVSSGSSSLKDAINDALRDWTASYENTHYLIGTVAGPAPFPDMVRQFQQIIGIEARRQIQQQAGRLPDMAIACVGGGSNAIGLFTAFIDDSEVKLVGVEPAGKGLDTNEHGATLNKGELGIFQGCLSKVLQTEEGQINESYSISAGLDYPGIGPQHVALQAEGRAVYESATDTEALDASLLLTRKEGIIPALESSHALAYALKVAEAHPKDAEKLCLLVNLSGRGDKDLATVLAAIKERGTEKTDEK